MSAQTSGSVWGLVLIFTILVKGGTGDVQVGAAGEVPCSKPSECSAIDDSETLMQTRKPVAKKTVREDEVKAVSTKKQPWWRAQADELIDTMLNNNYAVEKIGAMLSDDFVPDDRRGQKEPATKSPVKELALKSHSVTEEVVVGPGIKALKAWIADPYKAWWADNDEKDGRLGAPEIHSLADTDAIGAEIDFAIDAGEHVSTFEEALVRLKDTINNGIVRGIELYQWTSMITTLHNDTANLSGICTGGNQINFDGDTQEPPYDLIRSLYVSFAPDFQNDGLSIRDLSFPGCDGDMNEDQWDFVPGRRRKCPGVKTGIKNTSIFEDSDSGYLLWTGRGSPPGGVQTHTPNGRRYSVHAASGSQMNRPTIIETHLAEDGSSLVRDDQVFGGKCMSLINVGEGDDVVHSQHGPGGRPKVPPCEDFPDFYFLGEGNDCFMGSSGWSHVWAGPGDDTLINSYWAGTTFDGGPGDDYIAARSTGRGESGNVVVAAGTGDDYVTGSGFSNNFIYASAGNDEVRTFDHQSWAYGSFVDLGSGNDIASITETSVIFGGPGNDNITSHGRGEQIAMWIGGEGDDVLRAVSDYYYVLFGGLGNDILEGGARSDILVPGDGHDHLDANMGHTCNCAYKAKCEVCGADVIVLEPGFDNINTIDTWVQSFKFDVTEFGFSSFTEVQMAGFDPTPDVDGGISFELRLPDDRHAIVKIRQTIYPGIKDTFPTRVTDIGASNFIVASDGPFSPAPPPAPTTTPPPLTWELIARQRSSSLFDSDSKDSFLMNADDAAADAYMTIGQLDANDYRAADGTYRFELVWDNSTVIEWKQTSWLKDNVITGFECIAPSDCRPSFRRLGAGEFLGLGKSTRHQAVLDGDASSHRSWFNCVGAVKFHGGGIPGWNKHISTSMELRVEIP